MPNISLMPFQKLDCYVAAKELARLVHEAGIGHSVLRDQACRASVSCFLQLSGGLPNEGAGMRRKYFTETQQFAARNCRCDRSGSIPGSGAQRCRGSNSGAGLPAQEDAARVAERPVRRHVRTVHSVQFVQWGSEGHTGTCLEMGDHFGTAAHFGHALVDSGGPLS